MKLAIPVFLFLAVGIYATPESCPELVSRSYLIQSKYLEVNVKFLPAPRGKGAPVESFRLAYRPPSSAAHPLRIGLGDKPILLNSSDIDLVEPFFSSEGGLMLGDGPLHPIVNLFLLSHPELTYSEDNRPLGNLPYQRIVIGTESGKFRFDLPDARPAGISSLRYLLNQWATWWGTRGLGGRWHESPEEVPALEVPVSAANPTPSPAATAGSSLLLSRAPTATTVVRKTKEAEAAERRREVRRDFQYSSPAYSKTAGTIEYGFVQPYLKIHATFGPYDAEHSPVLKSFRVEYEPARAGPFNLLAMSLGRAPISITLNNVKSVMRSTFLGLGEMIDIYVIHPEGRRFASSYFKISLDTGQLFHVSEYAGFVRELWRGEITNLQFSRPPNPRNTGVWSTTRRGKDESVTLPVPSRLLSWGRPG